MKPTTKKNGLRKTERFGDKKKLKNGFWNFNFDFGDLIENNKFIELETVIKIIENIRFKKKCQKIQLLEF